MEPEFDGLEAAKFQLLKEYLRAKQNAEVPYTAPPKSINVVIMATAAFHELPEHSFESLQAKADRGDPSAKLDVAVHQIIGYRTKRNESAAMQVLEDIRRDKTLPKSLRARATSHIAELELERLSLKAQIARGAPLRPFDLAPPARAANEAISLGLLAPGNLFIANYCSALRGVKGYEDLAPLWKAYDRRLKEMDDEASEREAKAQRKPNRYRCANTECAVESLKGQAFMKCTGGCDGEVKPYYCSEACSNAHWQAHKPFCKPGMDRYDDPRALAKIDGKPFPKPSAAQPGQITEFIWEKLGAAPIPAEERRKAKKSVKVTCPDGLERVVQSSDWSAEQFKEFKAEIDDIVQA